MPHLESAMEAHYEEGGWGWVVLTALFSAEFAIYGNVKALGVFAETISREFETDLWLTGWVISLSLAVQYLTAPLLLPFLAVFGRRPVLLLGGVMATAGYLLAAFSQNFIEWSIFMVGFAGVGTGCLFYPLLSLLATYFKKYYPLVLLTIDLGMSFGTLLYGPITQLLLDTYGWRWAMAIIAALTFHLVPCAAVAKTSNVNGNKHDYQRIPKAAEIQTDVLGDSKTDDGNLCKKMLAGLDLAVFSNVRFVFLTFASCVVAFCFVGWAVYVVPHGIHQGLTPTQSSFLPSSFGVGNIVGKVTASLLTQMNVLGDRVLMCIGALLASAFFIIDPFVTSFAGLLLVTIAIGIGNGICSITKSVMYRNMTSDEQLLSVYSWHALFLGLSDILAGFASGWLFEVTGSFTTTFFMFGVVEFLAVIALILDHVITSRRSHDQYTKR